MLGHIVYTWSKHPEPRILHSTNFTFHYISSHQLSSALWYFSLMCSHILVGLNVSEIHILNIATNEQLRGAQKKTWNIMTIVIKSSFSSSSWIFLQKRSCSRKAGNHAWFVWRYFRVCSYVNEDFRKGRWNYYGHSGAQNIIYGRVER